MAKAKNAKAKKPAKKTNKKQAEEYDNEMKGVLFNNKRKTNSSQPDVTGSATIDGVEYWVSGWKNKSKQGVSFISLSFNTKESEEEEETDDDETEEFDLF